VSAWLYDVKHTFSFSQRLHTTVLFQKALRNKSIVEKWIAIHSVENSVNHDRLGIIVGKRYIPKASDRNRIKRYVREAFRIGYCSKRVTLDIVVRLRKHVHCDEVTEFRQTMSRLLTKVRTAEHDTLISNVDKKLSVSN
jgi:ribonuclease P protein component